MTEETRDDYDRAAGPFHHVRLHITNVVQAIALANDRWWRDPKTNEPIKRNIGELLMLTVSELAEGMEGDRKNLMDDKLPHRKMLEVELGDAVIRIFDMAGHLGMDLGGAIAEKLEYNAKREDHTHAARLAPGGKKY